MKPVKVVIVDDSKLVQAVLQEIFSNDPRFIVAGIADDPHQARQVIKEAEPDVITLDVEMPKMNGIAFLRNLMRLRPTPVVMISTLTAKGASVTMEALDIGAIDFVEKPSDLTSGMEEYRHEICEKVLAASQISKIKLLEFKQRNSADEVPKSKAPIPSPTTAKPASGVAGHKICAIGGSTGGLEALSSMLKGARFTGKESVVVCLHLPAGFTASYAKRLDGLLPIRVKEGEHNEQIEQGCIYIAPGGLHMKVKKAQGVYRIVIEDTEPVSRHKPSVDVLFDSVARQVGASAMGVILTGMGRDGADGLNNMAKSGCDTYAQDEATSVVWGMPGSAVECGAVSKRNVLPLLVLSQRFSRYYQS